MSWFYVDDRFGTHAKAVAAGNAALGLWVRAGSWSMAGKKDGFIPDETVTMLGGTRKVAERLVAVGLWCRLPTGYAFHDWDVWQLSPEDRAKKAEAGRKGGQAKAANATLRRIGG